MMEKERIVVSLTSYKPRLTNLPKVLDTIFAQSMAPDVVVLNLAYDEVLPDDVAEYLKIHNIDIFRVADTKVYKKLIPTLKRYPNDAIITIDDDFLYPQGMIEEFSLLHSEYPDHPIGGSHWSYMGLMVPHCGCASLTKSCFLGDYINEINDDLIQHCPCDDIVYSYLSVLNGHPYICTRNEYFLNMQPYNEQISYSESLIEKTGQQKTFEYLKKRFGELPGFYAAYLGDNALAYTLQVMTDHELENRLLAESDKIRSSHAYKLGKVLTKPFSIIRNILSKS